MRRKKIAELTVQACLFAMIASAACAAGPVVRFKLDVPAEQLTTLKYFIYDFAATESFSVYDQGAVTPPLPSGERLFFLKLREVPNDSIEIDIDQAIKRDPVSIFVYELKPGSAAKTTAMKLEQTIKQKWPSVRRY